MCVSGNRNRPLIVLLSLFLSIPFASAQTPDQAAAAKKQQAPVKAIPVKVWRKWLSEDVLYIITDQERADFGKLANDRQRDEFIEAFWERRNPIPGATENTFKEQHYRRIAYANEHFASGVAGWKTDRGRIYIVYGPPDEIESHPRGAGLGALPQHPSETWRYKFMLGIGQDIFVEFVDACECGDYRLTADPTAKRPAVIN